MRLPQNAIPAELNLFLIKMHGGKFWKPFLSLDQPARQAPMLGIGVRRRDPGRGLTKITESVIVIFLLT